MFPEIHALISEGLDATISQDRRRKAFFTNGWSTDDHFGYGLADAGKLVGVLGMIFCERPLGGETVRFCNLHSWYVRPEYRAKSLLMLKPIMDLKEHIVTDFSPSKDAATISKRLGFVTIDQSASVMPPLLSAGKSNVDLVDMLGPPEQFAANISEPDLLIYRDHRDLDVGHLLVQDGEQTGIVSYSRIDSHWFPYCLVHYFSDAMLFARQHAAIRSHLMRRTRGRYVVVDSRLLGDVRVPGSFQVRANEKLCRSTRPLPCVIDSLYSEVVALKLSTLPTFHQRLRAVARKYLPDSVRRRITGRP